MPDQNSGNRNIASATITNNITDLKTRMEQTLNYRTTTFQVTSILNLIESGRLKIFPEFGKNPNWTTIKRSRLIESILMGLPAHTIWCEEESDGRLVVLDGSNRLQAIYDFCRGKYQLSSLTNLMRLNGDTFSNLPYNEVLKIEDRYPIPISIVSYDTSADLRSEFYWRMFESGSPYKTQVARNFGYKNGFEYLRKLRLRLGDIIFATTTKRGYRIDVDIDECLLYALVATTPVNRRYPPEHFKVSNLLDSMMQHLSSGDKSQYETEERILDAVGQVCSYYNSAIIVDLSEKEVTKKVSAELFTKSEFIWSLVRASSNKTPIITSTPFSHRLRFNPRLSAEKFFKNIEAIQND